MLHQYVGTLETGQPFVAAHTLIPREQLQAASAVDSLSGGYGTKVRPDEYGWIVRPLAADVTPTYAETVLSAGDRTVEYLGRVTKEQMASVLGAQGVDKVFARPTSEYDKPQAA